MSWRAPRGRSTATPLVARGRCKGASVGWIRDKIDFVVLHPCYPANSAPQLHQCTGLSAEKIRAGVALALKQMTDRGWKAMSASFVRMEPWADGGAPIGFSRLCL